MADTARRETALGNVLPQGRVPRVSPSSGFAETQVGVVIGFSGAVDGVHGGLQTRRCPPGWSTLPGLLRGFMNDYIRTTLRTRLSLIKRLGRLGSEELHRPPVARSRDSVVDLRS